MRIRIRKKGVRKKRQESTKRRQTTGFGKTLCYSSAFVQRSALQKMYDSGKVQGIWGFGKANNHFEQTRQGRRPHHHVEAVVDCRIDVFVGIYHFRLGMNSARIHPYP